jgi:hypothetical protein
MQANTMLPNPTTEADSITQREERERERETIIGLTLFDRMAGDRLRDPTRAGNPHDLEYAKMVEEAGGGPNQPGAYERGLQLLRGLTTAAECEPWIAKAELWRTQRFRQTLQRLEGESTLAVQGGAPRVITDATQLLDRLQQAVDKYRNAAPLTEVRESEGGSTSTTTPSVEELLTKLRLHEPMTPQAAVAGILTKEGRKEHAEFMANQSTFFIGALTEVAMAVQQLLTNQKTSCIVFNERSTAMEQLLTKWVPQIEAQMGHNVQQIQHHTRDLGQLRRDLDEATAGEDMMQGLESMDIPDLPPSQQPLAAQPLAALATVPALGQHLVAPMMVPALGQQPIQQPILQQPTAIQPTGQPAAANHGDLPPGLTYCMVGGEVFVCLEKPPAGSAVQPIPYQSWVDAVKARINPFEPDRPSGNNGTTNKVRLPNPKTFSGEAGDTDPDLAILSFETWLEAAGIPEDRWAAMGQSFLSGAAHRAYSAVALAAMAKGQTPTWQEVRQVVKSFRRQDAAALARAKLASMRQTGTVAAYNRAFSEQLAQVGSEPPAAPDLLRYYLNGLARVQILSPQGQLWGSLHSAMEFHLQREMAEISVRPGTTSAEAGQKRGTGNPVTGHPLRFHKPLKPRLRVMSSQGKGFQRPQSAGFKRPLGDQQAKAGNPHRDRPGTSKSHHGKPDEATMKKAFGLPDLGQFFRDTEKGCPVHPNCARPHTKGECGEWVKIRDSLGK